MLEDSKPVPIELLGPTYTDLFDPRNGVTNFQDFSLYPGIATPGNMVEIAGQMSPGQPLLFQDEEGRYGIQWRPTDPDDVVPRIYYISQAQSNDRAFGGMILPDSGNNGKTLDLRVLGGDTTSRQLPNQSFFNLSGRFLFIYAHGGKFSVCFTPQEKGLVSDDQLLRQLDSLVNRLRSQKSRLPLLPRNEKFITLGQQKLFLQAFGNASARRDNVGTGEADYYFRYYPSSLPES